MGPLAACSLQELDAGEVHRLVDVAGRVTSKRVGRQERRLQAPRDLCVGHELVVLLFEVDLLGLLCGLLEATGVPREDLGFAEAIATG